MDKVEKFFQKLSEKDQKKFQEIKTQIESGNFAGIDIKNIKSSPNLFRVRLGKYRLVFSGRKKGKVELLKIVKRDDNTYRNL